MAAWEFSAGRVPHRAAALFCLPLLPLGLVWTPRRMQEAFRVGRRSRSLHGSKAIDRLVAAPLQAARAELAAAGVVRPWPDRVRFALIILQASAISLAPLALLVGLWLAA